MADLVENVPSLWLLFIFTWCARSRSSIAVILAVSAELLAGGSEGPRHRDAQERIGSATSGRSTPSRSSPDSSASSSFLCSGLVELVAVRLDQRRAEPLVSTLPTACAAG